MSFRLANDTNPTSKKSTISTQPLLEGFGSYRETSMAINGSINYDRPRASTKKRPKVASNGETMEELNCVTNCLSCFKGKTDDSKYQE